MTQREREQREVSAQQVIDEWQVIKRRLLDVVTDVEAYNDRAFQELRRKGNENEQ